MYLWVSWSLWSGKPFILSSWNFLVEEIHILNPIWIIFPLCKPWCCQNKYLFLYLFLQHLTSLVFVSVSNISSWSRRISYNVWRISSDSPVLVNRTALCKAERNTGACCTKLQKALNPESLLSAREWWRKVCKAPFTSVPFTGKIHRQAVEVYDLENLARV